MAASRHCCCDHCRCSTDSRYDCGAWHMGAGWLASRHPGVPVIVVGNLTVGGTGKTPLVIRLAQAFAGGGTAARGCLAWLRWKRNGATRHCSQRMIPRRVGDEAVLIARRTAVPVAIGADRAAAAELLVREGCTLVLADDGLQHLALQRDVTIAVVDGARGFGNGALLPAGPLRETKDRLDVVDMLVLNGEDLQDIGQQRAALRMTLAPAPLRNLLTGKEDSLDTLRGSSVHAVAGIGNPQRFFDLLRSLGAQPVEHALADHHAFQASDLAYGDTLRTVMTEKDAVKCAAFATERMWCLPVNASLQEADLARLLRAALVKTPGRGTGNA